MATSTADFVTSDHYHVLNVPRNASEAEITKAYKALARRYHPDKNPQNKGAAEASFKRIAEAYAVLRDPERRQAYDESASRSYCSFEEAQRMYAQWGGSEDDEPLNHPGRRGVMMSREWRQRGVAALLVVAAFIFAPRLVKLLPAVIVLGVILTVAARRERMSRAVWWIIVLLMIFFLGPRLRGSLWGSSSDGGVPQSGEEILGDDGKFLRVPDPRKPAGGVKDSEWREALVVAVTRAAEKAMRRDGDKVVLVISSKGCPWCTRQVRVLHSLLQRQADQEALVELVPRRLRFFILDAEEFPDLAQVYRVEVFPTLVIYDGPDSPTIYPGFLGEAEFHHLMLMGRGTTAQQQEEKQEDLQKQAQKQQQEEEERQRLQQQHQLLQQQQAKQLWQQQQQQKEQQEQEQEQQQQQQEQEELQQKKQQQKEQQQKEQQQKADAEAEAERAKAPRAEEQGQAR